MAVPRPRYNCCPYCPYNPLVKGPLNNLTNCRPLICTSQSFSCTVKGASLHCSYGLFHHLSPHGSFSFNILWAHIASFVLPCISVIHRLHYYLCTSLVIMCQVQTEIKSKDMSENRSSVSLDKCQECLIYYP